MTAVAESLREPRAFPLLAFLRDELAPRDGRLAAVARITASCVLVVFVAMLYQIPEPAYIAYLVFMVSQREVASTLLGGVVAGVSVTLGLLLTLLLFIVDASEPALRLPLMGGVTFLGMFLSRIIVLGPAAFLAGFIMVITQTILDGIPNLEVLTRLILWLWVVVMIPIVSSVLIDLLAGQNPGALARRAALKLLAALVHALRHADTALPVDTQSRLLDLILLRQRAAMLDPAVRTRSGVDAGLIETLGELLALLRLLPPGIPADVRTGLADACDDCRHAFEASTMTDAESRLPSADMLAELAYDERAVIVAMMNAVRRLATGLGERSAPVARAGQDVSPKPAAHSPLVPDAFSNPDHVRFALKTALAAMTAYILYNALDWPGIRTSVITCFFVALGTVGETMHKLVLRLSGAVIGGLLGALCIVFVLPSLTDIGELCLLVAATSAAFAWVATSSERLAYAGMQMAFAFYLGVLQGYGPATDLTILRDRVAGILLGNVLMSVVFSTVWPVGARSQARAALGQAALALAQLLATVPVKPGQRLAVAGALAKARRLAGIALFERGVLPAPHGKTTFERESLEALEDVAAASFVIVGQGASPPRTDSETPREVLSATWLSAYGSTLVAQASETGEPQIPVFERPQLPDRSSRGLDDAANALLESRIERLARHAI